MYDKRKLAELLSNISVVCNTDPNLKPMAAAFNRASKFALTTSDPQQFLKILKSSIWSDPELVTDIESIINGTVPEPYASMLAQYPDTVFKMPAIKTVTPSTSFRLYNQFQISSIDELAAQLKAGHGEQLGFSPEQVEIISESIASHSMLKGRKLWFRAWLKSMQIELFFKNSLKLHCMTVGDVRMGAEIIENVDFITEKFDIAALGKSTIFGAQPKMDRGIVTITTADGFNCRFFMVNALYFGTAVLMASSPQAHVEKLKKKAAEQKLVLSYTGLKDAAGQLLTASRAEKEIYKALGVNYVSCELRYNDNYLETPQPKILTIADIKGEAHNHSLYSDGSSSFEDYVNEAKINKMQWLFLGDHITDRMTGSVAKASFLKSRELTESRLLVLRSAEADIMADGSLQFPAGFEQYSDMLFASVHDHLTMSHDEMTERLLNAVNNPFVNVLSHPFGRIIGKTRGYSFDTAAVFKACAQNNVMLEINGAPERQDLDVRHVQEAKKYGCKFILSTDAHSAKGLLYIMQALIIARRAGLEKSDVFNVLDCDGVQRYIKNGRKYF